MTTDPVAFAADEGIPVTLPSGGLFPVLVDAEAEYLTDRVQRYMADNHFSNVSDLQDVDRMLMMEVLCFRWGNWLSRQRDYFGDPIDENSLRRSLNDYSSELRQLKKILGIDKSARDRQKGDDSVPVYLENLLIRAREFGIMRNDQQAKAIELVMQLQALLVFHDNCLAGETEVITSTGTHRIAELAGQVATVLDGHGGWVSATVTSRGVQPLTEIGLSRWKSSKTVFATPGHRWFVRSRTGRIAEVTTADLRPGQRLVSVFGRLPSNVRPSVQGIGAGIVFGDGHAPSGQLGSGAHVVLCGDKDAQLLKYFGDAPTRQVDAGIMVCDLPRSWKQAPSLDEGLPYLYGWLAGYMAADGTVSTTGSPSITAYVRSNLEVARDVAYRLGIPTLGITEWTGPSCFGGEKTAYRLNFPIGGAPFGLFLIQEHMHRVVARPRARSGVIPDWQVTGVRLTDRHEEVFCPVVSSTGSFTLADNVLTGNCDEPERREQHVTQDEIFDWIREVLVPEFNAIDKDFRSGKQKSWVRSM